MLKNRARARKPAWIVFALPSNLLVFYWNFFVCCQPSRVTNSWAACKFIIIIILLLLHQTPFWGSISWILFSPSELPLFCVVPPHMHSQGFLSMAMLGAEFWDLKSVHSKIARVGKACLRLWFCKGQQAFLQQKTKIGKSIDNQHAHVSLYSCKVCPRPPPPSALGPFTALFPEQYFCWIKTKAPSLTIIRGLSNFCWLVWRRLFPTSENHSHFLKSSGRPSLSHTMRSLGEAEAELFHL